MGLFKPAWKSENKEKALKAVNKESDQAKLAEIAKYAPLDHVCIAAVQKVSDQAKIADIVQSAFKQDVRILAIHKMTEQAVDHIFTPESCKRIAELTKDARVRSAVYKKFLTIVNSTGNYAGGFQAKLNMIDAVTDQKLLAEIAKSHLFSGQAYYSVYMPKLTDQDALLDVVMNAHSTDVSLFALYDYKNRGKKRLTDQAKLAHVAKFHKEKDIRDRAIWGIDDPDIMSDIINHLKKSKDSEAICKTAEGRLESIRKELAKSPEEKQRDEEQRQLREGIQKRWQRDMDVCHAAARGQQGKLISSKEVAGGMGIAKNRNTMKTYLAQVQIYCNDCKSDQLHDMEYVVFFPNGGSKATSFSGSGKAVCKACGKNSSIPLLWDRG